MKMSELFQRIDRSQANRTEPGIDTWAREFDISIPWGSDVDEKLAERMYGCWAIKWYCADAWVGLILWFLDDEPIAASYCQGRKCDVEVEFVSNEQAIKLRELIYQLVREEKQEESFVLVDMDQEVGEAYNIAYGSQLLVSEGLFNGEPATVVKTFDSLDDIDKWRTIVVDTPKGEVSIGTDEFQIPYPLEKL